MPTTTTTALATVSYDISHRKEQSDGKRKCGDDYCKCGRVAVAKTAKLVDNE